MKTIRKVGYSVEDANIVYEEITADSVDVNVDEISFHWSLS